MGRFAAFFWFFCFPVILMGIALVVWYFSGGFIHKIGYRILQWVEGLLLFGMPVVQLVFYFRFRGKNDKAAKGILYAFIADILLIPAMYLYVVVFLITGFGL